MPDTRTSGQSVARLLGVALALAGPAHAAAPIGGLRPIVLHDGVNTVPRFLPDGATATIVQAWRANGNAHGWHDWLVLAPTGEGHGAVEVTLTDDSAPVASGLIRDDPFDGERVLRSVRFARGTVKGRPASLLLEATLDQTPSHVLADHATATVRVFRLEATGGDPGESPLTFRPVWRTTTTLRYCNAELALAQVLPVPLPANYRGPNRIDGCFER